MKVEKNKAAREVLHVEHDIRTKSRLKAISVLKLVGEFFNIGLLTSYVVSKCIHELLKDPTELDIEGFHVLYVTTGAKLETDPKGVAIADSALTRLEEIIDKHSRDFCERIRMLMLDVFEQRAKFWDSEKPLSAGPDIKQDYIHDKMSKEALELNVFLKDVNALASQWNYETIFSFMNRANLTQERLDGSVLIIFERALASPPPELSSWFAFLCMGLADITGQSRNENPQAKTFKDVLLVLCSQEIATQLEKVSVLRGITEIETLKNCYDEVVKEHAAFDINLRLHNRMCSFATFYAELFNFGIVESRLIFDYFTMLSSPKTISNTSIECFCLVVKLAGTKLRSGANGDVLLKNGILKLHNASQNMNLSSRSKFFIQDLLEASRLKLKLSIADEEDFIFYRKCISNFKTIFSKEYLWEPLKRSATGTDVSQAYFPPHNNLPPINSTACFDPSSNVS